MLPQLKRYTVTKSAEDQTVLYTFFTISVTIPQTTDPLIGFEKIFNKVLYGHKSEFVEPDKNAENTNLNETVDNLAHWPSGQIMRSETFQGKSGVHMPFLEYLHKGHCRLKVTKDFMQTAVNAFAIFVSGDIMDIKNLPASYVLNSARTIAMMKVEREKLAATWHVVKGSTPTQNISYEVLEKFRPLFKHVNAREIARLNLSDDRILSYIGTHPDLNRHQVGVVASRYLQLNPRWTEPRYLNLMNNLLCGVPMTFMRRIPENTYLQLTHQLFYHIRACDPLQRRFYLTMMMRTQALGKSYSWSAREVSRLGLLLAEVSGSDLSAINPEAMSGITSQVMLEMPIHSLLSITEMQLRYLDPKTINILARKLISYQEHLESSSYKGHPIRPSRNSIILVFCVTYQFWFL
ncbi:uncharacterized protein LOC118262230 isoform X2 [Spodoptera frugiperda]|uniref:Uncharacterized protein LOC118262230 isoform X2 n=1 Tax=Spodoptera frugiperda TaxID=7108 RepID=A0A9R0EXW3_SPOFR|nr:uncharacterized protein LOC118262230 isoform X2 [Spodoptera frugiperda]